MLFDKVTAYLVYLTHQLNTLQKDDIREQCKHVINGACQSNIEGLHHNHVFWL